LYSLEPLFKINPRKKRTFETNRKGANMNNIVEIDVKTVYGQELSYPRNAVALTFAKLTGKKTLTANNLKHILNLGYEIKQVQTLYKAEGK